MKTSKHLTIFLRTFLLAAIFLAPLFCRTETVKLLESGCSLIVENHLEEDLEFFIEGARLATIKPGEVRLFIHMREGELKAVAHGVSSRKKFWASFNLIKGKETRWKVVSEKRETIVTPQAVGKITVKNLSAEPIRLKINGVDHEMLWEKGEAVYPGFPSGKYQLEASGAKTEFTVKQEVSVTENSFPVWIVKVPYSSVIMTNLYHELLYAEIEGREPVAVGAFASASFDELKPGQYTLTVMDSKGRGLKKYVIMLSAGEAFKIDLRPSVGALSVVNTLPFPVTIFHETKRLGDCKGDGAVQFEGVIIGESSFYAVDPKGAIVEKTVIKISPDSPGVWLIKGGYAGEKAAGLPSLLLKNSTGENVEIRIGGSSYGNVDNGTQKIFPGIPPGKKVMKALGKKSRKIYSAEIVFAIGERVSYELLPKISFVTVKNERKEDVLLYINGKKSAVIPGKSTIEFPVKMGKIEIEAKGKQTLHSQIEKLDVLPDLKYRLTVHEFGASITLENRQDEPLKLSINERDLGIILPFVKLKFPALEPGEHLIRFESLKLPVKWERRVFLKTGDEFDWILEK